MSPIEIAVIGSIITAVIGGYIELRLHDMKTRLETLRQSLEWATPDYTALREIAERVARLEERQGMPPA